jgi:alcohol dehydrogenase
LVDTSTTAMLLKTVLSKSLRPELLITHRFSLEDIMKAYDTFGNAATEQALKVLVAAKGA